MSSGRKALIIACGQYENEGLRQLPAPAADAAALEQVLSDAQIGGFDVQVVENEPAHVVKVHVEDLLSDARPDDVLLLHFSGHGLKSESGELYFAAHDTRPNRLASTAVSADFVERGMRSSRSRSIVLFLDCCYGGAFGRGMRARAVGDANVLDSFPGTGVAEGRGRAVITASNAMEYAFEGDSLADDHSERPSVFTTALVQGLTTGEADRNEDGWVSLNELYDYVFDRVREQTPHQTPSRDIQMQGELYLARSRRRKIRAAPIPPDLLAATTDANMFTRIGAVSELRARLTSDDLAVAAGAYDALTDIARTDIKYVADAAAEAVGEAALRVSESTLHFGEVAEGTSVERVIHLDGPPLARACTVEASHSWIRTEEATDGILVSVDTSTPGWLQGSVSIKSPTGEAVVDVDVEVVAVPVVAPSEPAPVTEQAATVPPSVPQPTAAPETVPPVRPAQEPRTATPPAQETPAAEGEGPVHSATRRDRLRDVAGAGAIASALLSVTAVFTDYEEDTPVLDIPELFWSTLIGATVAAVAGAMMFLPRTRRLIGPGFLIGAAAAASYGLVIGAGYWLYKDRYGFDAGFSLLMLAQLLMVAAACLAILGVALDKDVSFAPTPHGRLPWLIALLGIATALVLVFRAANYGAIRGGWLAAPSVCIALVALAILGCASIATPRRLGTAMLAGWIAGGVSLTTHYAMVDQDIYSDGYDLDSGPTVLFALILLGLLVATTFFARAAPTTSDDRGPEQPQPSG